MSPRSVAKAIHSLRLLLALLSIVVVIGFAAAGYEINHQRSEINGLRNQVNGLNIQVQQLHATTRILKTAIKSVAQP